MYFKQFPKIQYQMNLSDKIKTVVTNILKRVDLSKNNYLTKGTLFYNYQLEDGERPEHIADRFYGNPEYHWIILLINQTVNPYFDWLIPDFDFEKYLEIQ
jgi:hypothetical protein